MKSLSNKVRDLEAKFVPINSQKNIDTETFDKLSTNIQEKMTLHIQQIGKEIAVDVVKMQKKIETQQNEYRKRFKQQDEQFIQF